MNSFKEMDDEEVERTITDVEPSESDAFHREAQNGDVPKSLIRINVGGRSARLEEDLVSITLDLYSL